MDGLLSLKAVAYFYNDGDPKFQTGWLWPDTGWMVGCRGISGGVSFSALDEAIKRLAPY
jgi:hypothetical protein